MHRIGFTEKIRLEVYFYGINYYMHFNQMKFSKIDIKIYVKSVLTNEYNLNFSNLYQKHYVKRYLIIPWTPEQPTVLMYKCCK